jgi:hypothetical protein
MANSSFTGAGASGKSYPHPFQTEAPPLMGGLVQHALVSPSVQVQILSIVDEAGSASIGDIIAELPGHPDPVGAIMVLVGLNILVVEVRGVLDANTVVRRAESEPDPDGSVEPVPNLPDGLGRAAAAPTADVNVPAGLDRLDVNPFSATLVVGSGVARRAFARMDALRRPGIYGLINGSSCYIGMGSDAGMRIAAGQQPIEAIDTIFVITDANGNLTEADARAAERMLWSRVAASRERVVLNGVPDGAPVDPQRYSELDAFVAQACLALRHHGILFTTGSARSVLAGPRTEPGRVEPLRPLHDIPDGEVLELGFGGGRIALAARQSEDRWVLLQGSEVRPETVASANASARFLRSAWLHAGLLVSSVDGQSYMTSRDLVFPSGSAAAQFCCGSKGKGLAGWRPIDPDGGYDPDTAALIAS